MAAAAATELLARGTSVPWAGLAAGLSLASAPLHVWLLLAHPHSAVMAAALLLMTALCALCAVRVLRGRPIGARDGGDSELRGLLLMADAMALAHAMLLLLASGGDHHGGHGGHGSHGSPVVLGADHAAGAMTSMLLLVGLELAVAACAALALRSNRRALG